MITKNRLVWCCAIVPLQSRKSRRAPSADHLLVTFTTPGTQCSCSSVVHYFLAEVCLLYGEISTPKDSASFRAFRSPSLAPGVSDKTLLRRITYPYWLLARFTTKHAKNRPDIEEDWA